jgi:hypothetical protein
MANNSIKSLKTTRLVLLLASFLITAVLTIILTISITLASFGSTDGASSDSKNFGTILMQDVSSNFTLKNSLGNSLGKVYPGQTAEVDFSVQNVGTADMHIRFKLVLENENVDTSIFGISLESAYYQKPSESVQTAEYVKYDFSSTDTPDEWYVRRNPLIGNADTATNDPPDSISMNINFPGELMTDEYKNENINLALYVESVQVANNGSQRDIKEPGYDVVWSE